MKRYSDDRWELWGLWLLLLGGILCFFAGLMGCATVPVKSGGVQTTPIVTTPITTGGAASPVKNAPVTQAPGAESQGILSILSQRTVAGIDPVAFLVLLAWVIFLSHRRERLRILRGRK